LPLTQNNHAQHRHDEFDVGQLGVGAQLVGGFPQAGFDLTDVADGVGGQVNVLGLNQSGFRAFNYPAGSE
jgi:hypothetical protein